MCGIAGYLRFDCALPPEELRQVVERMAAAMVHRGPDDHGVWVDPKRRCALAHRRLSIIDTSSAGRQPMASRNGRHVLTYNGEIYNYRELRPEVERHTPLRTRTDTEVLLEALAQRGADVLPDLDGMYAFALFDTEKGSLLLARDPFGEKPLYTFRGPQSFAFASELHALQALPEFDDCIEIGPLAEYLALQYVDAPRTLYRGARKLEPGHLLRIDARGTERTERHFSYRPGETDATRRSLDDLTDELEDILTRSVKRRLVSDVPLGAFLSGGIDSSTTVALVRKRLGLPIRTFSIGFADTEDSEHLAARRISEHLGTEHHEELLRPDLARALPDLGRRLDEPNGDASCLPQLALASATRKHVTVAISGDGGDEMFGGYSRYTATLRDEAGKRGREEAMRRYYQRRMLLFSKDDITLLLGFVPASLEAVLDDLDHDLAWRPTSLLAAMRGTDASHYLPGAVLAKVDRMSMLHSLEVRTPFLTREIAAFAEGLPDSVLTDLDGSASKRVLRRLASRYLPDEITSLPKRGFGFGMRGPWDGGAFVGELAAQLQAPDSALRQIFDPAGLDAYLERQRDPKRANLYQVSSLVVLESYLRSHPAGLPKRSRGFPLAEVSRHDCDELGLLDHVREVCAEGSPVTVDRVDPRPPFWATSLPPGSRMETPLPVAEWMQRATEVATPEAILLDRNAEQEILLEDLGRWRAAGVTRVLASNGRGFAWFDLPDDLDHRIRRGAWLRERLPIYPFEPSKRLAASSRLTARITRKTRKVLASGVRRTTGLRRPFAERVLSRAEWAFVPWLRGPALADLPASGSRANFGRPEETIREIGQLIARTAPVLANRIPLRGEPVRIALVVATLGPGGAERQAVNAALEWRAQGHEVSVIATEGLGGPMAHHLERLRAAGVGVHGAHRTDTPSGPERLLDLSAKDILALRALPKHLQSRTVHTHLRLLDIDPHLAICMLPAPILFGGVASHLADVPTIALSVRSLNPTRLRPVKPVERELHRLLAGSARVQMLANSKAAAKDNEQWLGLKPGSFRVVPNGLTPSAFARAPAANIVAFREDLGIPPDAPIVLAIMRLSEEKRPLLFIELAAMVCAELPETHAVLVGDGPLLAEARRRIEELSLCNRVHLAGRRNDVSTALAAADVVALTSEFEGLPNALLEAQAIGVPVVACGRGGVIESMAPGESGVFDPEGTANTMALACTRLLRDPDARARMGEAGRKLMRDRFRADRMAADILAVLIR